MIQQYPSHYLEGLQLFNEREFFACHDVLEELWTDVIGEEKEFYQGLIQAAVALFHFENTNLGGAARMYLSAKRYLKKYHSPYMGIDLNQFLNDLDCCFEELLQEKDGYPASVRLIPERIPVIELPEGN